MKKNRSMLIWSILVLGILSGCGQQEIQGVTDNQSDKKESSESSNEKEDSSSTTGSETETSSKVALIFDAGNGTCDTDVMLVTWGEPFTLPKPTVEYGLYFKGWYLNDVCIPQSGFSWTYSHVSRTLVAHYFTDAEAIKVGILPSISDITTITYGLYPQTRVADTTLIATLNTINVKESNGYYFYDGCYYSRKTASPCKSTYAFGDGTIIEELHDYWFKCEPIEWKILDCDEDLNYSVVSTVVLDAHDYYSKKITLDEADVITPYPNNYKYSDIRTWLNNDFYNAAFSLDSFYIQTTKVDNNASTTDSSTNQYACGNTKDKVYLLSYQDYENEAYFPDNASRYCKPTDYAKANGAYCHSDSGSNSSYKGNGYYWTRSPFSRRSDCAWGVDYGGDLCIGYVYNSANGVRPAITIKL